MKCEAVIFDLDGTILDTLPDLHNSLNYALDSMGYETKTLQQVRMLVGNGIGNLIKTAVPQGIGDAEITACLNTFMEHYNNNLAVLTKPYDDIFYVLHKLKSQGIKLGVLSNKRDEAVQVLVDRFFPSAFDYVSGEKQGVPRKPHPQGVFDALKQLDVSVENTFYVGDSDVDIQTAKNAGLSCIAVSWGFRDKSVLIPLKPEYIIDKPSLLADIILKEVI